MAVYTRISREDLKQFLTCYDLGALVKHEGVSSGIENTNYFVTTTRDEFVLTIFEGSGVSDLNFCLQLMEYLAARGVPSARPIRDRMGDSLRTFAGKPTVMVERLPGRSLEVVGAAQCAMIGHALGRMHGYTQTFPSSRANERDRDWHRRTAREVQARLDEPDRKMLETELALQRTTDYGGLSHGVVHADLFRDNVLFDNAGISGLIDFYYAFNGPLLYDVAVVVADWCFDATYGFDQDKTRALIDAYRSHYSPTSRDVAAWPALLRAVGLRFWLSRLKDKFYPREGAITHTKDPASFKQFLLHCHASTDELAATWD